MPLYRFGRYKRTGAGWDGSELINGQMVNVDGYTGEVIKAFDDGSALVRFRLDQTPEDFKLFGPEVLTRRFEAHQMQEVENHASTI